MVDNGCKAQGTLRIPQRSKMGSSLALKDGFKVQGSIVCNPRGVRVRPPPPHPPHAYLLLKTLL